MRVRVQLSFVLDFKDGLDALPFSDADINHMVIGATKDYFIAKKTNIDNLEIEDGATINISRAGKRRSSHG